MSNPPKRHLPKFNKFKAPLGYVSLHDALNRWGIANDPLWGVGWVWKHHPYFFDGKRFQRWRLVDRRLQRRALKFGPLSTKSGAIADRSFRTAISALSTALQKHDVRGYLLGDAHEPDLVPLKSVQWVRQSQLIFSTGYMKINARHLRIILSASDVDRWLGRQKRQLKNFIVADDTFVAHVITLLNLKASENGKFRYSSDRLWKLIRKDLASCMKRSSFRTDVFEKIDKNFQKKGRGPSLGPDIKKFEAIKIEIQQETLAEVTRLKERLT